MASIPAYTIATASLYLSQGTSAAQLTAQLFSQNVTVTPPHLSLPFWDASVTSPTREPQRLTLTIIHMLLCTHRPPPLHTCIYKQPTHEHLVHGKFMSGT